MLRAIRSIAFLSFFVSLHAVAFAQDIRSLKHEISSLCAPAMAGRGYVAKGREHAALHIMRKMRDLGLKPVTPDSIFYQYYSFPVITFPDTVDVTLGKRQLVPG